MDEARELQLEIFRNWAPKERLVAGFKMMGLAIAMRNARIRHRNPDATEAELRELRCRESLGLSRDEPLPWTT